MIGRFFASSSRKGAGVALALSFSVFCVGQTAPTVYVNPRAGADDPRVGLKSGLYDAGTAAAGMELVTTMAKPAGFAPDAKLIAAYEAAPTPPPPAPGAAPAPRPTPGPSPYGTTNSDLAFAGNHFCR